MNALILGILLFQFVFSLDYVFPDFWENVIEWHKSLFEPLEVSRLKKLE